MITINEKLYNYLYNEMGATYSKDPKGVGLNVDNSEEENLNYLGTYFPRSFVESYRIYDNIFSNEDVFEMFNKNKIIKILDIGSGTGGDLIGLLQVLLEKFADKKIEVTSIDGNKNALQLQFNILNKLQLFIDFNGNELRRKLYCGRFRDKNDMEEKLNNVLTDNSFDIVNSFKFVNEFYKTNYNLNKGMYIKLIRLANEWLKKDGILCLVDITNRVANLDFMSIIFNDEVRKYFINEKSDLNYIIPKCCSQNYASCNKKTNCFSRVKLNIQFCNCKDISKINYKLFIKSELGSRLRNKILQNDCGKFSTCYCRDSENTYNCTKMIIEPYKL